jgi:mRNA interferase RelE/StbE
VLKGEFRGLRRVRVGDYRIVYELMDEVLVVLVVAIPHRQDAYRRRQALPVRSVSHL